MKSKQYIEDMLIEAYSEMFAEEKKAQALYESWLGKTKEHGYMDRTEMDDSYNRIELLKDRINILRDILID